LNEDAINLVYITDRNHDTYWIGKRYELACHRWISWIYNDELGNIVFEITPAYPQGLIDQDNDEQVQQYQMWMNSYQPFCINIILQEKAEQLLRQAETILAEIVAAR